MIVLKERIDKLSEENNVSKAEIEKYKQTIDLLEKELSLVQKDKIQIQETLKSTNDIKVSLETKINNYQQQINETEQQFSLVKNDCNQYMEVCYFSLYYKNILYKFKDFINILYFTEIEHITSRF